jgi:hypothetical protein
VYKGLNSKVTAVCKSDISTFVKSEIPEKYNETKIIVIPRNPICMYVYWEITHDTNEKLSKKYNENFGYLI